MAKSKYIYTCNQCGYESTKWNGKCPSCGAWNSFEEDIADISPAGGRAAASQEAAPDLSDSILELEDIGADSDVRYDTGIGELNRVLGGGLVKGSLVLLGGEPGIGKSTILLQICQFLGEDHSVLYVSGEESARQIKLRAQRLGVDTENLYILTATDAEAVARTIASSAPDIAIIDSIQTMSIGRITSSPGSLTQVRECTNLFMHTAKNQEIPIIIVGHVNKDGAIAGPKVMEHIVDAVLYFEGERHQSYRILRAVKNRFGSTNEIGVFEMLDKGLREVANPSQMLLEGRPHNVSGTCVACVMEGSRPILAEVQALASKTGYAAPRRMATGFDFNRLNIIIAVLEKRLGVYMGTLDVYLNIVGGFRLDEPAGDLPVAMALYSGIMDKQIDEELIAFGEIGLGGEIRSVSHIAQRIREAERMGFKTCVMPKQSMSAVDPKEYDIEIIPASTLKQAFAVIK
ncbi:DNA repair protein RadA [Ruminococcus flavefaciens]|uniref:DNA repair protein RadA n=1 Tax=Ruminococcus flavefaciens TaxID=1265 RepID=A0A315Y294_RUMFL|nr:DNA repair protein RadA [Ruminococcus flavefaciens]PWJ14531.1 DNA repair protein RadA/Sms [Ruminococcus flavefaciens]SSA42561.1 DNA repair protein RadA/Sms [Ruminococcus flavefaciens]